MADISEAMKLLYRHVYYFLVRQNMHAAAEALAREANIQPEPDALGTNVLFDLWSNAYFSRPGINPGGNQASTSTPHQSSAHPVLPATSPPLPSRKRPRNSNQASTSTPQHGFHVSPGQGYNNRVQESVRTTLPWDNPMFPYNHTSRARINPSGNQTSTSIVPHHNYTSRPPPEVLRPPSLSVRPQARNRDQRSLVEQVYGPQPHFWKVPAVDEFIASMTSRASRAQPWPSMGSSMSSQQVHFANPPRNVDPAGFRIDGGEQQHGFHVSPGQGYNNRVQESVRTTLPWDNPMFPYNQIYSSRAGINPAENQTSASIVPHQSSASVPPYAHHVLPAPDHINMVQNIHPSTTRLGRPNLQLQAPNVHLVSPVPDPNQQLEAVDPNQQLEAVNPTTAPGSLDHVS